MKRDGAGAHAFFHRGRWHVNPPVVHPPDCVCSTCKRRRRDDEWDREVTFRIDRMSPYDSEARSIAYAAEVKKSEEARLRAATDRARHELLALGAKVTFGVICSAYRTYQRSEGKRLDRDKYRVNVIEQHFGVDRDPDTITKSTAKTFREWLVRERHVQPATVDRYFNTLMAILNGAVKDGLLASHQLKGMRRARAKKNGRPKTFTPPQVNALQGPAMDAFEREQAELKANGQPYSQVPLRGFCLIGYRTLLRPSSNYRLRWEELDIDCDRREGTFRIDAHKNSDKGVVLEGPLAGSVVDYLLGIMPAGRPRGYVHVNPRTGKPFVNIRRAWKRLTEIANSILPEEEQIRPDIDFYNWRHTGASALAAAGADPVLVTKLMGDSSLRTVLAHYFDSSIAHMRSVLLRWEGRD